MSLILTFSLSLFFFKSGLSSLFHVLILITIFVLHKVLPVKILIQPIQTVSSHFYITVPPQIKMSVFYSNEILWPYN